jgi:hypothetical protein
VEAQQLSLNANLKRMTGNQDVEVRSDRSASSLQLTLENRELTQMTEDYIKGLESIVEGKKNVMGFFFAINENVNSADVYGNSNLFRDLWPKLLHAAVVEAIADYRKPAPMRLHQMVATRLETQRGIVALWARALTGTPKSRKVNARTSFLTREAGDYLLFETRDEKIAGAWVHRNFMKKGPTPTAPSRKNPARQFQVESQPQQIQLEQ